jgi:hypothetical protein
LEDREERRGGIGKELGSGEWGGVGDAEGLDLQYIPGGFSAYCRPKWK